MSPPTDPSARRPEGERGGDAEHRAERRFEDEPALVRAVQNGDRRAFGALVQRYLEPAYAVALGLSHNEQDAEDGVQAAFLRALERIDQLRPGSPFGPWFYSVLRSTCLNLLRRESLREHGEIPAVAAGKDDPEKELGRTQARERVLEALERLPEQQRMAVFLYDLEGYDHAEIARIMNIAVGTSRANLHHGRRSLRRALQGSPDEDKTT
jgi:RNA polymerase sigma-70 factor (ECF subfamily)